jgi:hypothetical protein
MKDKTNAEESRWSGKQIKVEHHPHLDNKDKGFFSKFEYKGEPYTDHNENTNYKQAVKDRKNGFGSSDVFKSGEFTNTRATERYRDKIKSEARIIDQHRDPEREAALLKEYNERQQHSGPPCDKAGVELRQPEFFFDMICAAEGTPYTPQTKKDCFYTMPKHAPVDRSLKGQDKHRRLGTHRTQNQAYGDKAWEHNYKSPQHGQANETQKFFDHGHLR